MSRPKKFIDGAIPWDEIRANEGTDYLIAITDVRAFLDTLPEDMTPASQEKPFNGIPKNVWVGGTIKIFPAMLHIRAYRRFLIWPYSDSLHCFGQALDYWRCSNCGHRGDPPRPTHCPHKNLCGDARLDSQIHYVVDFSYNSEVEALCKKHNSIYWNDL